MRNFFCVLFLAAAAYGETPETVLVTYHPKAGKETEMLRILKDEWAILTRLNLVTGGHQLYRARSEGGDSFFVEIFTWKDAPDMAPPEVRKVWAEMHANVEKLEFVEITPITSELSLPAAGPSR
jgi:hypothetical protein